MLHSVLSDTDYGSGHNTIDKTGFDKTILYLSSAYSDMNTIDIPFQMSNLDD